MLFHNEAVVRDGEIVSIVTSGNYGHHLGGAIGMGYVPCAGESAEDVLASTYEIEMAGERHAAKASLKRRCMTPARSASGCEDFVRMETAMEPVIEPQLKKCRSPWRKAGPPLGGRAACRVRTAPLAENLSAGPAGHEGGQYSTADRRQCASHPFRRARCAGNHRPVAGSAIGRRDHDRAGAILGDDGRLRFPRALVEDMLALAAKGFVLYGRDPPSTSTCRARVHFGTAGAAVHVVDVENRSYRESTAQDLYDAARLTHALDNVHFFQRAMVCRDVADNFEMDLNTLYACSAGTTKHVGTSFSDPSHRSRLAWR
jgi:hypothetical protein